jgi:hypothetical protein
VVYIAIGTNLEGRKDVLGMWIGAAEGARYWLGVLDGLKSRGVRDMLIVSTDELTDLSVWEMYHSNLFMDSGGFAVYTIRSALPRRAFMAGNIFVLNGGEITELHETPYENEDLFQSLIERYPNILAGEQINPGAPRKWILIAREMGVPSEMDSNDKWSLDHLFADQDAVPTFVEVKRSTDTRIRREVVAQMLDYAANGTAYWPMDKIRLSFEKAGGSLAVFGVIPGEEEAYWKQFEENLRLGKIRLLFVADAIPMELRRIIEFLNVQMKDAEVLGVEIRQYTSDGAISTLVPRIVGQTAVTLGAKGTNKAETIKWNEEMLFREAVKVSPESCAVCKKIFDIINGLNPRVVYSETMVGSSFGGGVLFWHGNLAILNLYVNKNKVCAEIPFRYMTPPPFNTDEKQLELIGRFNTIKGIFIGNDRVHKNPRIDLSLLKDESAFGAFMSIIVDIVEEHSQSVQS